MSKTTLDTLLAAIDGLNIKLDTIASQVASLQEQLKANPNPSADKATKGTGNKGKLEQVIKLVGDPRISPDTTDGILLAALKAAGGTASRKSLIEALDAAKVAGTATTQRPSAGRVSNFVATYLRLNFLAEVTAEDTAPPAADGADATPSSTNS